MTLYYPVLFLYASYCTVFPFLCIVSPLLCYCNPLSIYTLHLLYIFQLVTCYELNISLRSNGLRRDTTIGDEDPATAVMAALIHGSMDVFDSSQEDSDLHWTSSCNTGHNPRGSPLQQSN